MVLLAVVRRELLIVVNHTVVNVGDPFFPVQRFGD
jgi:hypothetical protein